MPTTDDDRERRAANHREFVESMFAHEANMTGKDPWNDGLLLTFGVGGSSDFGRIHRASCTAIGNVANSRVYKKHGGAFPVRQPGISKRAERCRICGTEDLPDHAEFWGDTDEAISARHGVRAHADRI